MANFIVVAKKTDIPAGSIKTLQVNGKKIAVANVGDILFAVDDLCTHEQCSLGSEGFLDKNLLTCGCHGSVFDVTNGKVHSLPATVDLKTYEVKTQGDDILLEI